MTISNDYLELTCARVDGRFNGRSHEQLGSLLAGGNLLAEHLKAPHTKSNAFE
jgi:hypothetical protein